MSDQVTLTPEPAETPAAGAAPEAAPPAAPADPDDELRRLAAERDEYLDLLRRVQAEFENFRKRVRRDRTADAARAARDVVARLLPVFDAIDAAVAHDRDLIEPLQGALRAALEPLGLERFDPLGAVFDPTAHDAAVYEEGGEGGTAVVVEVLRPGYRYRGQLLRPAAVKVRG